MKPTSYLSFTIRLTLVAMLAALSTSIAFAQEKRTSEFCSSDNYYNGDKVGFKELREMTAPATSSLTVDAGRNGGIRIRGENRSDIRVRACVQTWGMSDEAARSVAAGIKISTSPSIHADGAGEENWSVSYEILTPRNIDLNLTAHNGGISISSVEGRLEFATTNGGLHLDNLAGDVKGRTTNGGVHVELAGNAWKGSGLDLQTTNGGVHQTMPNNYSANVEAGTTNGGFRSSVAGLQVEKPDRTRGYARVSRINAPLNGGGAPIRVITTNGGITINSTGSENY